MRAGKMIWRGPEKRPSFRRRPESRSALKSQYAGVQGETESAVIPLLTGIQYLEFPGFPPARE
jgi:hypothetical protein